MNNIFEVKEDDFNPKVSTLNPTHEDPLNKLAQKTSEIYQNLPDLKKSDSSLASKVSNPPLSGAELVKKSTNFMFDILGYGQKTFNILDTQMNLIADKIEEIEKLTKEIVDVQKKLTKLAGKKSIPITDELRQAFENLKSQGVDVLPAGAKEISVDALPNIKNVLDTVKSQQQYNTQRHFVSIQQKAQQYNSIIDSLKIILRHYSNLLSTISQHMSR